MSNVDPAAPLAPVTEAEMDILQALYDEWQANPSSEFAAPQLQRRAVLLTPRLIATLRAERATVARLRDVTITLAYELMRWGKHEPTCKAPLCSRLDRALEICDCAIGRNGRALLSDGGAT